MQRSLLLFIILLFALTISVYFGNASLNVSEGLEDNGQLSQNASLGDMSERVSKLENTVTKFFSTPTTPAATTSATTTPAATTQVATTPAATTQVATTPAATTPAATTQVATTPAATTPAATTPVATTSAATTPATTTPAATTSAATTSATTTSATTTSATTTPVATTPVATTSATTTPVATTPVATTSATTTPNPISDYYKWLVFWSTISDSKDKQIMMQTSSYVPKTSIPVIPDIYNNNTCYNCQSNNGVCVGCGGLGGNGTSSTYKNKFSDFLSTYGGGYKGAGKWVGFGGGGPSLSRLAEETGSGAVDLTKTALNDVTSLASGAGSGAVGLLKDTGSGAVGLLKDTGSGAVGLLKDAGSGAASLLKSNPVQISNINQYSSQQSYNNANPYQSQGTYNLPNNPLGIKGIDPYSYNGALVSKGGNYIPITDDFSAFRK